MAVDFSLLPSEEPSQDVAPSRLFWTIAFFTMVLVGVFIALFFWPQGVSTRTYKFWACIALFPVGIPILIVLRRYAVYEGRKLEAALRNEAVQAFNGRVFSAASVPLVLMGAAHRFSADRKENAAEYVRSGSLTLKTQELIAKTGDPVKARWLTVPGMQVKAGSREDDRRRSRHVTAWLFGELLDELAPYIRALPSRVPLTIGLAASNGFTAEENKRLWQECWFARELRPADFAPEAQPPANLMMLDAWLDETLGNNHLHAMLLVTVQLNPLLAGTPPAGTTEAGSSLLLVPASVATQYQIPRVADLHRPVQGLLDQPGDALSNAARWAGVEPEKIANSLQSGLDAAATGVLREAAMKLSFIARSTNLDQTVGCAGIAAPWLALSCAASLLTDETNEQIVILGHGNEVHCAVIKQPIDGTNPRNRRTDVRTAFGHATSNLVEYGNHERSHD
jgi:hypothetical protein